MILWKAKDLVLRFDEVDAEGEEVEGLDFVIC